MLKFVLRIEQIELIAGSAVANQCVRASGGRPIPIPMNESHLRSLAKQGEELAARRVARRNVLEVGRDNLIAFRRGRRVSRGEVPIWGVRWLRYQFHEGRKAKDIARELGVAHNTVSQWASAGGFQPLSAHGR